MRSRLFDRKNNRKDYLEIKITNGWPMRGNGPYATVRAAPYFRARFLGFDRAERTVDRIYETEDGAEVKVRVNAGDFQLYIGDILEEGHRA